MSRKPSVFISSTCYDLKQIRANLKSFIEDQLGYDAILSEYDSFPIDPNVSAIQNCLNTVRDCADIFVLIVGGRYGQVTNGGKSVTNLEYVNARNKNIPIYAFVDAKILNIMPVWKTNKSADFSSVVDSVMLFEFVDELRGKDNVWVYGFDHASDIVNALRNQLAYLFFDSLNLCNRIKGRIASNRIMNLNANLLQIVLEKPRMWEYILFGEAIFYYISLLSDVKRDYVHGLTFCQPNILSTTSDITKWINTKLEELSKIVDNLSAVINKVLPTALGEPGVPGNDDYILYAAERFAACYGELLTWNSEFRALTVGDEWSGTVNALSQSAKVTIEDIDQYCEKWRHAISEIRALPEKIDSPVKIDLSYELRSANFDEFNKEVSILKRKYHL